MKDVALDDLIKEDREKAKLKRGQGKFKARNDRGRGRTRGARRFQRKGSEGQERNDRNDNRNRLHPRKQFRGRQQDQPRKFANRINRNRDRVRQNQPKRDHAPKKQQQPRQQKQQAQKQQKGRTLHCLGLHPDITNEDLYKLFASEGALEKCMIEQDNFGRNLPSALVKYYAAQTAKKAIQNINGKKVMNSVLTVEHYKHRK